jgi:hypothetical protein
MTHNHKKKKLLPTRQKPYQLKDEINDLKAVRPPRVAKKIHFCENI